MVAIPADIVVATSVKLRDSNVDKTVLPITHWAFLKTPLSNLKLPLLAYKTGDSIGDI